MSKYGKWNEEKTDDFAKTAVPRYFPKKNWKLNSQSILRLIVKHMNANINKSFIDKNFFFFLI